MKKACFDGNGFLLWILEGDLDVQLDPGAVVVDVPDTADANDLFLANGQPVARQEVELVAPKTMLTGSADKITVTGLPNLAWVCINGKTRKVTGGALTISAASSVELVGPHRSNFLSIEYQTLAQAADAVRAERDARLAASDWTQMSDAPVGRAAWGRYRQALRDLPAQQSGLILEDIIWPQPPQ